ncbi:hypothetical protein KP509_23G077800 [Ceratopteris richardii]|uniref:Uncharacterized protein n=1 Tax=Ceratopteris richardii TaxID=49495 RepID=A0A8T2S3W8_CERRI|nr:hypothetical protein KP509_23G077800 [Ceratopteris richardii]
MVLGYFLLHLYLCIDGLQLERTVSLQANLFNGGKSLLT